MNDIQINIAVDAMGGDNSPTKVIRGCELFLNNNNDIKLIIFGNKNLINKDFFAIMSGTPDGKYLISSFIKDDKMPKIGDILVTSGNANVYPKDILVGKIISIIDNNILALPFVNFQNIEFVQIIKNK